MEVQRQAEEGSGVLIWLFDGLGQGGKGGAGVGLLGGGEMFWKGCVRGERGRREVCTFIMHQSKGSSPPPKKKEGACEKEREEKEV